MLNVVVLNGGRGAASLIPALLRRQGINLTSIVNAYDDGKSTGEIRRFFDMLGPSDIRKVQELMLPADDPHHEVNLALFGYRYPAGVDREFVIRDMINFSDGAKAIAGIEVAAESVRDALQCFIGEFVAGLQVIERLTGTVFSFEDCSLMNCLYAGAYLASRRDLDVATRTMDRLFRLRGTVLPNSLENKWLAALRRNGEVLYSEAEIVELRSNVLIDGLYLLDRPLDGRSFSTLPADDQRYYLSRHHASAVASSSVRLALERADVVIYAAGTQHSSLYPTYMSRGIAETIAGNRNAIKVFVTNIGADYETPTYKASDYVKGAYRHLCFADGRQYPAQDLFSAILINSGRRKADETYVDYDEENFDEIPALRVVRDFESPASPGRHDGDGVTASILALHDELRANV